MSEGYIIEAQAITPDGDVYRTYRLAVTVGADEAGGVDIEHIDADPKERLTFTFKAPMARSCLEHLAELARDEVVA
jgi:hypothetical protein